MSAGNSISSSSTAKPTRQNARASSSRLQPAAAAAVDLERELPNSLRPTRLAFSSLTPYEPTTIDTLPALVYDLPPAIYASKLSKKLVPLSNPPRPSAHATTKAKAKARRQADKVRGGVVGLLSRKEAKRKAVWAPGRGEVSYVRLRGLADLWEGYARELLGLTSASGLAGLRLNGANLVEGNVEGLLGKLAKAEFVGATLTVKSAPKADLVGLSGIVIHETANTFKFVTERDAVRVVPKDQTVFRLALPLAALPPSFHAQRPTSPDASISSLLSVRPAAPPPPLLPSSSATTPLAGSQLESSKSEPAGKLELDLFGSRFRFRSADRAGRKFKTHGKSETGGSAGMKL